MTSASDPARPGLRERNKIRKEKLIREAARRLFSEKGYEATTLREVAEAADVGFGTVFAYATDKAGLLAMVYVEELKGLPPLFISREKRSEPLDQIVVGLGRLFEFWSKIPNLSQQVLQQMEFYGANPHMETIIARRAQSRRELTDWIAALQEEGRMTKRVSAAAAADTLFAIYTSAVRDWSASTPSDVKAGTDRLRQLMELPLLALAPEGQSGRNPSP